MNKDLIQNEALIAALKYDKCTIALSMGLGKTYLGLKHMNYLYTEGCKRFLVVAPKLSIFDTWQQEMLHFGLDHLIPCVKFTTYLSLTKEHLNYDCVYLDEAHNLLSSHDLWLSYFPNKILGLTGTPPRYTNSEKGVLFAKHCPVVYEYLVNEAVENEILNDYRIFVHPVYLDNKRNIAKKTKTGKTFYSSEQESYSYWTKRIMDNEHNNMFKILRMKEMMTFKSKLKKAQELIKNLPAKHLIFCNTIEQAETISTYSYHSKNSQNDENLRLFCEDKIQVLSCVGQLNEGINIPNLSSGIILHSYANERKTQQRMGRLLRLDPSKTAACHILMYKNTVDEQWVQKALLDFDKEKITYL